MTAKEDTQTALQRLVVGTIGFAMLALGAVGLTHYDQVTPYLGTQIPQNAYGAVLFIGLIIYFSRYLIGREK